MTKKRHSQSRSQSLDQKLSHFSEIINKLFLSWVSFVISKTEISCQHVKAGLKWAGLQTPWQIQRQKKCTPPVCGSKANVSVPTHVYASKSPLLIASISCSVTLMISCFRAKSKDRVGWEQRTRSTQDFGQWYSYSFKWGHHINHLSWKKNGRSFCTVFSSK